LPLYIDPPQFELASDIGYNRSIQQLRKARSMSGRPTSQQTRFMASLFVRARRPLLLSLVALILVMSTTGCQRASQQAERDQAPEIAAVLAVDPDPAVVGPATVQLQLTGASGAPIEDATNVSLKGDMSHAGMQPVLAEASGGAGGVYEAQWVWTMAGDWFVTVTATLPDGRTLVRRFELTVNRD
jgi:hypothetical protein